MQKTIEQNKLKVEELANDDVSMFSKKRYAFLDSLLLTHLQDPKGFTMKDIQDEVNTFMFEGHDTTSINLIFTSLLIASDQRVQVNTDWLLIYLIQLFGCRKKFMKNWNLFLAQIWIDQSPQTTVVK